MFLLALWHEINDFVDYFVDLTKLKQCAAVNRYEYKQQILLRVKLDYGVICGRSHSHWSYRQKEFAKHNFMHCKYITAKIHNGDLYSTVVQAITERNSRHNLLSLPQVR